MKDPIVFSLFYGRSLVLVTFVIVAPVFVVLLCSFWTGWLQECAELKPQGSSVCARVGFRFLLRSLPHLYSHDSPFGFPKALCYFPSRGNTCSDFGTFCILHPNLYYIFRLCPSLELILYPCVFCVLPCIFWNWITSTILFTPYSTFWDLFVSLCWKF